MSLWNLLEIEPTEDIKTIKRAYSKKLKVYHPEDDPEGFQKLREAYDFALKYAENNKNNDNEVIDSSNEQIITSIGFSEPSIDHLVISKNIFYNNIENNIKQTLTNKEKANDFFIKIEDLYNDFFSRIELKCWQEIFDNEIMWDLECKEIINQRMLDFLLDHYFLPKEVWNFFDLTFHWSENERYIYDNYPINFVSYMFKELSDKRSFRYNYFDKNMKIDYEKYLILRQSAFNSLAEKDYKKAAEHIYYAYEMYSKDPYLLCMKADCYFEVDKIQNATSLFDEALKISSNNPDICLYKAQILLKHEKELDALKICKDLTSIIPNDLELYYLVTKCYFKLGDFYSANRIIKNRLNKTSYDAELLKFLNELTIKLEEKLKTQPLNLKLRSQINNTYSALGKKKKVSNIDWIMVVRIVVIISVLLKAISLFIRT